MNMNRLVLALLSALVIAGCEGGGVDIGVETVDNSVDNSTQWRRRRRHQSLRLLYTAGQQRGPHRHVRRHELRLLGGVRG